MSLPTQVFTDHPRRPRRLRRGERRPEPDPPGRVGGPQRRPARRDRPRDVHDGAGRPRGRAWFPGAEVVSFGCKFTNPVVVPADGGVDVEVAGEAKPGDDGLTTVRYRHLRRPEGARHAQGSRACLSAAEQPARPHHAPPRRPRRATSSPPRPRPSSSTAVRRADEAGEPVLVLGGGSNLVVADEGFDGTVVKVATRGIEPDVEDAPLMGELVRRRAGHRGRRGDVGRPGGPGRRRAAGWASRRSPASPARSAPPRSRTSAPTARRSPRPSPRCGSGTAMLKGVRTFANADCGFGYRHSRFKADPGAGTSCSR